MLEFPLQAPAGTDRPRAGTTSARPGEIWIGLDTGGTFTDAVALNGERRVIAAGGDLILEREQLVDRAVVLLDDRQGGNLSGRGNAP